MVIAFHLVSPTNLFHFNLKRESSWTWCDWTFLHLLFLEILGARWCCSSNKKKLESLLFRTFVKHSDCLYTSKNSIKMRLHSSQTFFEKKNWKCYTSSYHKRIFFITRGRSECVPNPRPFPHLNCVYPEWLNIKKQPVWQNQT